MFKTKHPERIAFFVMVAILLLALPTGVMATKQIYKAQLQPIVDGAKTSGNIALITVPQGVRFEGMVANNTSPVSKIFILKKDGAGGESFRLSLCNMRGATCEVLDDGTLKFQGYVKLTGGVTGKQFMDAMYSEQLEVLVTTDANPDGEAGGTIKAQ
jgi:hypothetical protein